MLITQRQSGTDMILAGELLYYMASERETLAAVTDDTERGRFARRYDVGIIVPAEEPRSLAEAIRWMRAPPRQPASSVRTVDRLSKNKSIVR